MINEAVELAKIYGGTDGHKFVNGVLDKLAADVRARRDRGARARARRRGLSRCRAPPGRVRSRPAAYNPRRERIRADRAATSRAAALARRCLGIGDDAAVLGRAPGMELAVSVDMLVEGRHFFAGADPARLGHKTLAVNLSDMAAMGAAPRWALLAGALPDADDAWLAAFARGLPRARRCARRRARRRRHDARAAHALRHDASAKCRPARRSRARARKAGDDI